MRPRAPAPAFHAPLPVARRPASLRSPRVCAASARAAADEPLIARGFHTVPETPDPVTLRFTRPCPRYLHNHTYYRNGPGIFELPHADGTLWRARHWLDAVGTVHACRIDARAGELTYRSRMINDAVVRAIRERTAWQFLTVQIAQSQPGGLLDRLRQLGPLTRDPDTGKHLHNMCVSIENIPGKGFSARADANIAQRLDPVTLHTLEKYSFDDLHPKLTGDASCSHGITDPDTGEYFNYVTAHHRYGLDKVHYHVYRVKPDGTTHILASFMDPFYFLHSFALTPNYVVMVMWPAEVDLLSFLPTKSIADSIRLRRHTPTRFIVISRHTHQIVAEYHHPQFFCFHTVNAYEQHDSIHIDLLYYPDVDVIRDMTLDNIRADGSFTTAIPHRFTLPNLSDALAAGPRNIFPATSRVLSRTYVEFPSISPAYQLKPYKYMYGVSDDNGKGFLKNIVKVDVDSGHAVSWGHHGTFTGEPVFVPNPDGVAEDDGSLLVMVLDAIADRSSLVVLDARTMTETTRAILPHAVPHGFHGFVLPME